MTNTQSTPVTVDTKLGKLYMAVATANPRSYKDTERGAVTELRPELWVATDAEFDANPKAADRWTIRGRAYAVYYQIIRDRGQWVRLSLPYAGGFRDDRRNEVKFQTATWDLMWETLTEGLDAFAAAHPGWAELSRYMLHYADERGERYKAEEARREAAKHDDQAGVHQGVKDKAAKLVPASAMALFPGWQ